MPSMTLSAFMEGRPPCRPRPRPTPWRDGLRAVHDPFDSVEGRPPCRPCPVRLRGGTASVPSMTPLPAEPRPGLYRHYKGNDYRVLGLARHSETLEPLVVYQALYGERG